MKDNEDLKEASLSLKFSLMNRINYIRGEQRRKKLARKRASLPVNLEEEEVDEIEEETSKKKRFSKAEEYGLDTDRDLPNELPASETPTTQEAKRLLLANHNKSGESMSFACLMKLMKETYYMQRSDINTGSSMDKILERWPFIGMVRILEHELLFENLCDIYIHCLFYFPLQQPVLQTHFEHLMDMSVSDAINEAKAKLFPNLIAFFVTETSKKRFGDAKAIPLTLKSLLKRNSKSDDPALLFVTVILCCIVFMKVPKDSIFLTFEVRTRYLL